jgi:hypothetical protein
MFVRINTQDTVVYRYVLSFVSFVNFLITSLSMWCKNRVVIYYYQSCEILVTNVLGTFLFLRVIFWFMHGEFISDCDIWQEHKELVYICRVQSSVWRLPNYRTIDPTPPLHPASVSSPRTKDRGYTLAGWWGGGESIFRKTPDIGLAFFSVKSLYGQVLKMQLHAIVALPCFLETTSCLKQ